MRITEVVRNLIIINVLMFVATIIEPLGRYRDMLMMYNPFLGDGHFQSFQIVSHMFMHADLSHLFFNMFSLFMFGPILETRWGARRFLLFYLVSGLGAVGLFVLISQLVNPIAAYQLLGASGAVYGVLIGFMILYPNVQLMLLFPPIPMKAKYLIGGFLVLDIFLGVLNSGSYINSNTAHFAHVGGALAGFLMILFWRQRGERI